jgi:hypothetical protein
LLDVWTFDVFLTTGGDAELLAAGEGVRFLLLDDSRAVRSCRLMVFGILAVFNESLNSASELNLILLRTFHNVSSFKLRKTSVTRRDNFVVAVVDVFDMCI